MNTDERLALIKQVGEEIITEEELKALLESGEELVAYDGFEPSGQMHIAQGLVRAININKMTRAGIKFKMLVADWHAMANRKMGGDLEKIKAVGKYFIEVWRACGLDMAKVEFVWASDLVRDPNYWKLILQIAATNSYKRFIRTAEIMGRAEDENLTGAQIIYSCMQTADIFTLGAKITQLGMDQRKVNVLAREVGAQLGFWKPVIVSHHMMLGLQKPSETAVSSLGPPQRADGVSDSSTEGKKRETVAVSRAIAMKMSKSNPDSAIFMTDSAEEVERKINKAYCPEGMITENPVIEYFRYMIFETNPQVTIERSEKFGGPVILNSYADLVSKYQNKEIHPQDLKQTAIKYLNEALDPVRKHFEENQEARELLEKVKTFQITR